MIYIDGEDAVRIHLSAMNMQSTEFDACTLVRPPCDHAGLERCARARSHTLGRFKMMTDDQPVDLTRRLVDGCICFYMSVACSSLTEKSSVVNPRSSWTGKLGPAVVMKPSQCHLLPRMSPIVSYHLLFAYADDQVDESKVVKPEPPTGRFASPFHIGQLNICMM